MADVLSVKLYPRDLLLKCLPPTADILCTHPMFGPESGRQSWKGLPFVYEIVRVHPSRRQPCNDFISIWANELCEMVPMTCAEHDQHAASTQFITHTTGMSDPIQLYTACSCCCLCSDLGISPLKMPLITNRLFVLKSFRRSHAE